MTAGYVDEELPWGCWLRIEGSSSPVYVDDDTGCSWATLREAFWSGRLAMPTADRRIREATLELIHAVLATTLRRPTMELRGPTTARELAADLFGGNELFMRCFLLWLNREGFVALRDADGLPTEPTDEGRAALLMLLATRPHDVRGRRRGAARRVSRRGRDPARHPGRLAARPPMGRPRR